MIIALGREESGDGTGGAGKSFPER